MYFKQELKYSKRSGHVTQHHVTLLVVKKLSGRTLLLCKFSLPCDETSTLYSPQPSLQTFSPMFINAGSQRVIFNCPTQAKPQIYFLCPTR